MYVHQDVRIRELLTVSQAAETLGITSSAALRLMHRGTLPAIQLGFQKFTLRSSVDRLSNDPEYLRRSRKRDT